MEKRILIIRMCFLVKMLIVRQCNKRMNEGSSIMTSLQKENEPSKGSIKNAFEIRRVQDR